MEVSNKEIYIHLGPAKTGTSAVQKWLSSNISFLNEQGVYYPPHSVDINGVSSGNVRLIYDLDADKQLCLNEDRLSKMLNDFYKSEYSTLLLSSEFFFKRMTELKTHIPDAKFIGYIRNPLEIRESSYNQSVKRHFQTEKINTGRTKRLPYMDSFVEFIKQFNVDDLHLRVYGEKYFKDGNIVSDLLSILGINTQASLPMVNSSYQFEALEFKRWFNQFQLHEFQAKVDRALQGYQEGTSDYSLIPTKQYIEDSVYYSSIIENSARELSASCLNVLISDMKFANPKTFIKQELKVNDFLSVCHFLQKELKADYYLLTKEIQNSASSDSTHFHKIFIDSCDLKYKYMHKAFKLRLQVKRLLSAIKSVLK